MVTARQQAQDVSVDMGKSATNPDTERQCGERMMSGRSVFNGDATRQVSPQRDRSPYCGNRTERRLAPGLAEGCRIANVRVAQHFQSCDGRKMNDHWPPVHHHRSIISQGAKTERPNARRPGRLAARLMMQTRGHNVDTSWSIFSFRRCTD
jgi:hypothetical protein